MEIQVRPAQGAYIITLSGRWDTSSASAFEPTARDATILAEILKNVPSDPHVPLVSQNSRWAKKRYVAFKRRWPKHGEWADWGLRRESYKRRSEVAKQQQDSG